MIFELRRRAAFDPLRRLCGKYLPAEPGALGIGPLKAAVGVANATHKDWGRLKAADQRHMLS